MVKRQVVILKRAIKDMVEIERYLAQDMPLTAARLIRELADAITGLSELAERAPCPRDARLRASGYRYLVHRPYLIFFRISGKRVKIYRVLHGRRAYPRLL